MDQSGHSRPLKEVLAELERDGYSVGADRFARLKPFGIESMGSRGSLPRVVSEETIRRLRFLLEVEQRFDFRRDRDGLAFELAFARYPVIPWERVREDVYKRPKRELTKLNVAINKIAGEAETWLDESEIKRAAKNLARRYIPREAIRSSGHKSVAYQLLSQVFLVLLRVMYLNAGFDVADIRRILLMTELPIEIVDFVAPTLAGMLNDPNLLSFLRFGNKNGIVAAVENVDVNPEVWTRTFDDARTMVPVLQGVANVFAPGFDLAMEMKFPDIETIPSASAEHLKYQHILRTGIVGLCFMNRFNPKMREGLEAFRRGSKDFAKVYADLAQIKESIPMVLRLKHGE